MSRWQEVDRLVDEQKFEAASEVVADLLAAARRENSEAQITRALVKATQLRLALHGYETGVRFLRDEPWPSEPRHRLVLELFYGHSLYRYLQVYSWEIEQRERQTGEAAEDDLKTWTGDRIESEIHGAYQKAFRQREAWGEAAMGDLAAYVHETEYPPRIRGSLRDLVSYLWVQLLADTSRWRPDESNELYRLDRGALLASEAPASDEDLERLALEDAYHPIEKIRLILADLEHWHLSRNQPEAALEARLELLRRLQESLGSDAEDRQLLRADLARRLETFDRALPWWTAGQAELAQMWRRESEDPRHLMEARDAALAGARVHKSSFGSLRCQHLVAVLEAPRVQVNAMAVDGPSRRSVEVRHANAGVLHFRAYAVDPLAVLEGQGRRLHPQRKEVEALLRGGEPEASWRVELPATPDLADHRTFVTPPLEAPGAYILVSSLREDFAERDNARSALYFLISDLVMLVEPRSESDAWEVALRSGRTGDPRGVEVDAYRLDWRGGHRKVQTARTDREGRAVMGSREWLRHSHLLVARMGDHAALQQVYGSPQAGGFEGRSQDALIYTDRSVYRPGQQVQWKVVAYERLGGEGARFETSPNAALTVQLFDANGEEVASEEVETNGFGSASGAFTLTPGRLLGGWRLSTTRGGFSAIRVEEYKRPTFEVKIEKPEGELRLNETVTLEGRADYYFGLPVSSGEVRWRVVREPVIPPYFFAWGRFAPIPTAPPRVIAHGEGALAPDGSFEASFEASADPRLAEASREISYRYRLSAEVTDEGGETRQASRSVQIGFVAVEASVEAARPFTAEGE
ncbi:MAG: MG2 domain-containing protein, partial [Acidobacteriota bacterium]